MLWVSSFGLRRAPAASRRCLLRRSPLRACAAEDGSAARTLVIVESPAKARTIQKIVGEAQYVVESCYGHVRDLPSSASEVPQRFKKEKWSRVGIDVDNGFEPLYVVKTPRKDTVRKLKTLAKAADAIILATDGDREGEAISWHLSQLLPCPPKGFSRCAFSEITTAAIQKSFSTPRDVDMDLVRAQETRRMLDRLVGYGLSEIVWRKISNGISAGRVQSVALKLLVDREQERLRFRSAEYFNMALSLRKPGGAGGEDDGAEVSMRLSRINGLRVLEARDFGPDGLAAANATGVHLTRGLAEALTSLKDAFTFEVSEVTRKETRRSPPPPFITSTLQQASFRRLGLSAQGTMRNAQQLYESGRITYMRTDNPTISAGAREKLRDKILRDYGEAYLRSGAAKQSHKKPANAQEAHEAIRPAGDDFKEASQLGLDAGDPLARLYELVRRRAVASEMADAVVDSTSVVVTATALVRREALGGEAGRIFSEGDGDEKEVVLSFRCSGRVTKFPGFLLVGDADDGDLVLPELREGEALSLVDLSAVEKRTSAPARYTDASMVKVLEGLGVGRPSTYASIIETLRSRNYALREGASIFGEQSSVSGLTPSLVAFAVVRMLETHFPRVVDPAFTAEMEELLDGVAGGQVDGIDYLRDYYLGGRPDTAAVAEAVDSSDAPEALLGSAAAGLKGQLLAADKVIDPEASRQVALEFGDHAFDASEEEVGEPGVDLRAFLSSVRILVGPYGPYLKSAAEDSTINLPRNTPPASLSPALLYRLNTVGGDGSWQVGQHPTNNLNITLRVSRYGLYLQLGDADDYEEGEKPLRKAVPKELRLQPEDVTPALALLLLDMPREVCRSPKSGEPVVANFGPYGPYLKCDDAYVNIRQFARKAWARCVDAQANGTSILLPHEREEDLETFDAFEKAQARSLDFQRLAETIGVELAGRLGGLNPLVISEDNARRLLAEHAVHKPRTRAKRQKEAKAAGKAAKGAAAAKRKAAGKAAKGRGRPAAKKKEKTKRKAPSGPDFDLSEELQAVVGKAVLKRPQVVSELWVYIKANELQNPDDRREIVCDDKLKRVFGVDRVSMFGMNKLLTAHLTRTETVPTKP